jgi:purine-cytosine permease-like protein
MSDAELAQVVNQPFGDEATMLAAMELLESQAAVRAEDDRAEAMWIVEMQVLATPQSMAALDAFRRGERFDIAAFRAQSASQQIEGQTPQFFDDPVVQETGSEATDVSIAEPAVAPAEPAVALSLFDQIALANSALTANTPEIFSVSVSHEAPADEAPAHETPAHEAPADEALSPDSALSESAPDSLPELEAPLVLEASLTSEVQKDAEPAVFPLVPVGPAPDISVVPSSPINNEPNLDQLFSADQQVEQQITELQEHQVIDSFDEIFEISPQTSADFLDDARGAVSTAHDPSEKQGAGSLFLNWLPIGGSIVPVILAFYIHSLGLELTDAVVAVCLAIAAAFATTTIGAFAGKRAGLSTFIVSRATFGVFGARIPAVFFAIVKLVTSVVLVLFLLIASNSVFSSWAIEGSGAKSWDVLSVKVELWQIVIGATLLVASGISLIKLKLAKFLNSILGALASLAVFGLIPLAAVSSNLSATFYYLDSWPKTLGAAIVSFAALGTVWSSSGADFARDLRKDVKGSSVFAWSSVILLLVPSVIATATLILLQNHEANPNVLGFSSFVPNGYEVFGYAIVATVLVLLAAIELRSASLALGAVASWLSTSWAKAFVVLLFAGFSVVAWMLYGSEGLFYNLRDYAIFVSVPVAAWLGIFSADTLLRRISYHEISLTRTYGFYGNYNWVNIIGWAVASAVGFGMTSSSLQEFEWLGFLSRLAQDQSFWVASNLGIVVTFAIGLLVPICFGLPRIKRQEAEVLSIESRRYELRDVLVSNESEPGATLATTINIVVDASDQDYSV